MSGTVSPNPSGASSAHTGRLELTQREFAVAQLVGEALTNKQIARRLLMSPHTVNFHLRQIYRKLGTSSRVRLACCVREAMADELVAER